MGRLDVSDFIQGFPFGYARGVNRGRLNQGTESQRLPKPVEQVLPAVIIVQKNPVMPGLENPEKLALRNALPEVLLQVKEDAVALPNASPIGNHGYQVVLPGRPQSRGGGVVEINPVVPGAGADEKVFQVQRKGRCVNDKDVGGHSRLPPTAGFLAAMVVPPRYPFLEQHDVFVLEYVKAVG